MREQEDCMKLSDGKYPVPIVRRFESVSRDQGGGRLQPSPRRNFLITWAPACLACLVRAMTDPELGPLALGMLGSTVFTFLLSRSLCTGATYTIMGAHSREDSTLGYWLDILVLVACYLLMLYITMRA